MQPDAVYTFVGMGTAFVIPPNPGPLVISSGKTSITSGNLNRDHSKAVRDFKECNNLERTGKKQIAEAVIKTFISGVFDHNWGFCAYIHRVRTGGIPIPRGKLLEVIGNRGTQTDHSKNWCNMYQKYNSSRRMKDRQLPTKISRTQYTRWCTTQTCFTTTVTNGTTGNETKKTGRTSRRTSRQCSGSTQENIKYQPTRGIPRIK